MKCPLSGCRVLDLGIITAGAATSALLADLGAEVVKVESPSYRDPFRNWSADGPQPRDGPPFFRFTNRNKRAISLDLKRPQGRALFLRLAAESDVVLENFRRGVMARLGIDYAALRAVNPRIILASISSQGEAGPDANYVSFGSTLDAMGGLAWLTGYADGGPVVSGRDINYPDQVVAIFAAGMVVTAWLARAKTGAGAHLDLSQRELTSFLVGEAFVAGDVTAPRNGNAQAPFALQDCFRVAGGDWLAVTVAPEELSALRTLIGDGGKAASAVELGTALARWLGERPLAAATAALASAGIAAAPVLDGKQALEERGRLWRIAIAETAAGVAVKGFPFQLERAPLAIEREAPAIGADTAQVLARLGGYTRAEIEALASAGAIECAPHSINAMQG
ncbi:MAG TPA: CoA transferase [Alphaproteobacteria bacterium]|nr:CoA transferase [Alphaproteobacteria bacterium]